MKNYIEQYWVRTFVYSMVGAILCQSSILADGFRNPPEGAAALGRAGVRLTQGDDLTAITHNPANLMDLQKESVEATFTFAYSKTKYTAPYGVSEESEDPWTVLPAIYAAMPVCDGAYILGVGLHVPYGQAQKWNSDGVFRIGAPYYAMMKSININPTLATRIGEKLTVGVGADVMWSELEFKQGMPWLPPPAGLMGPVSRLRFDGDGYGLGANVGLSWKMTDAQRLAVTYRSPVSVEYDGDFQMDNPPPPGALPPMITPSSDFETEIDFAALVAVGYGVQLSDTFRAEVNVEWVEHSRNKSLDLDIKNNNMLLEMAAGSTSIPQDWDDTWTVGIGADWQVAPEWTLRTGWTYLPTPVPETTTMPSLAEEDRHIFALGAGYKKDRHSADIAYVYNFSEDRTVDTPLNPVNGNYEFDPHLVALSYTCSF